MRYVSLALLVVAMLALLVLPAASAVRTTKPMSTPSTPGNITVDAVQVTAKVVSVNQATRTVSLQMPDGKIKTYKLGKDVKGLNMLKKGDTIRGTLLDALAVYIQKSGGRPTATETTTVMLAPRGTTGFVVADTIRITGKIQYTDMQNHTVTITGPSGMSKAFKVGSNVKNLSTLRPGDDVVIRYTEALAIDLRKPTR